MPASCTHGSNSTPAFDPAASSFAPGPQRTAPRQGHAAGLYAGRVTVIGGADDRGAALATTEVLGDDQWARGPDLRLGRVKHAASTLRDGRIFVAVH